MPGPPHNDKDEGKKSTTRKRSSQEQLLAIAKTRSERAKTGAVKGEECNTSTTLVSIRPTSTLTTVKTSEATPDQGQQNNGQPKWVHVLIFSSNTTEFKRITGATTAHINFNIEEIQTEFQPNFNDQLFGALNPITISLTKLGQTELFQADMKPITQGIS